MTARTWRLLGVVTAGGLIASVLWRLPLTPPDESHAIPVLTWVLAFAVYCAAVVEWRRGRPAGPAVRWREHRGTATAIGALIVVASIARLWHLGSVPFVFSGDEAGQGLETLAVLSGVIRNPFTTGRLGMPTGTFFFNSATVWWLGPSPFALRLPWALLGVATVVVAYFLIARLTHNRLVALASAAGLAVYHYHIHYSRLALNNAADPLIVGLALICLYRAFDEGRRWDWVWTGATCGLAFYGYPGGRLVVFVTGLAAARLVLMRLRQNQTPAWAGLAVAAGAFVIVAAPVLQHAIRFPDDFNARVNAVGIVQSGWLARETVLREETAPPILLEHFTHVALAFNYFPGSPIHYGWPRPLLDPVTGVFFMLGLLWATARVLLPPWDERLFPMVAWWWLGILFGGVLTEPPPSSARLLTVVVPVCFFAAAAFRALLGFVRQHGLRLPVRPALAVAVALFAANSLYGYFVTFTPLRTSGGRHAELATELAGTLGRLGPGSRVYLLGAPHMFADFPTLAFFARSLAVQDVPGPLVGAVPPPVPPGDLLIVLPHRIAELPLLAGSITGGIAREIRSPVDGQVLATLYQAQPGEAAGR